MAYIDKNEFKKLRTLSISGILLGVGMGGFLDGILFHQIFQLHNMLSNRYFPDTLANEQLNMMWDGIFHAFTWLVTAGGIILLWKLVKKGEVPLITKFFVGSMILGWGLFNLIEGIINHHILQVHHVVERAQGTTQLVWDLAFLASGILFITIGRSMRRNSIRLDVDAKLPNKLNPQFGPST